MARSPVLYALERKYARLLGCQSRLRHPPRSIAEDLDHIAAVMRLFDPDWQRESVRPIVPSMPSLWGRKGQGVRTAFAVLREVGEPLTTQQIAVAVLDRLGIPEPGKHEMTVLRASFSTNLLHQAAKGLLAFEGRPKRWMLTIANVNSLFSKQL